MSISLKELKETPEAELYERRISPIARVVIDFLKEHGEAYTAVELADALNEGKAPEIGQKPLTSRNIFTVINQIKNHRKYKVLIHRKGSYYYYEEGAKK